MFCDKKVSQCDVFETDLHAPKCRWYGAFGAFCYVFTFLYANNYRKKYIIYIFNENAKIFALLHQGENRRATGIKMNVSHSKQMA